MEVSRVRKNMKISGHTKPFAVLGHPIGHTLSPIMHNAAFAALEMDAIYLALNVHPDKLMRVLPAMRDMGFGGVNLTVPLKEVAARGLSSLSESAEMMGAVNTVQFTDDGLIGHNTDGAGFLRAFEEAFGSSLSGKSIFILGTGGAGRAVALACAGAGAVTLSLADLDQARAEQLAAELKAKSAIQRSSVVSEPSRIIEAARAADVVVQSTPVGMKPEDASPLSDAAFCEGQCVFDLVYMYPETAFMKAAKRGGAAVSNGLGMLLHQGAKAFEIWTGTEPPVSVMRQALEQAVYGEVE